MSPDGAGNAAHNKKEQETKIRTFRNIAREYIVDGRCPPSMQATSDLTAAQLSSAYARGELSPVEVAHTVLERIANDEGVGCARIDGEVWTARAFDDDRIIEPGERVQVIAIRGATALVD